MTEEPQGTTWLQSFDGSELEEIIFEHMSHKNMLSCAKIMNEEFKSDRNPRDFTRFLIHQFAERYRGPEDIVGFVKSLVIYLETFPCLKELVPKLEWLRVKINLKRKAVDLCHEDEMSRFPECMSAELSRQEILKLDQYPDIQGKLMHLVMLILHNPNHYQILQTFCQTRSTLRKYVLDGVQVRAQWMVYVSIFYVFCSNLYILGCTQ